MKKNYFFIVILIFLFCFILTSCDIEFSENMTIKFDSNGGSKIDDMIVSDILLSGINGKLEIPIPVKEGFVFDGWYKEKDLKEEFEKIDDEKVLKSITLYAKWLPECKVYFNTCGGDSIDYLSIGEGKTIEKLPKGEREGYKFAGWYKTEGYKTIFNYEKEIINDDITLYAKWIEESLEIYTVIYESNGGSHISAIIVAEKSKIMKPEDPIKENCDFMNWYCDNNFEKLWDFENDIVDNNTVLYAKWEEYCSYDVSYYLENDELYYEDSVRENAKPISPEKPKKEGFTFVGWYTDIEFENIWDFENGIISHDLLLYACFIKDTVYYNINFYTYTDQGILSTKTEEDSKIQIPENIEKENHIFAGWYLEDSLINEWDYENDNINEDISLFAKWQTTSEDFVYYFYGEGNAYVISNYIGEEPIVVINEELYGKPITKIGKEAFKDNNNLIEIDLSENLKAINDSAFWGCTKLKSIILPDNITYIGNYAFAYCDNMENFHIGNNSILQYIGKEAFRKCSSLKGIFIPKDVVTIGAKAFYICSELATVVFDKDIQLKEISTSLFDSCKSLKNFVLPESITKISSNAFMYCSSISEIFIPENVEIIESKTFYYCSSLTNVFLSNYTREIAYKAFMGCENIKNIVLPDGLEKIDSQAFNNCFNMEFMFIPKNIQTIDSNAFNNCLKLKVITEKQQNQTKWNPNWDLVGTFRLPVYWGYSRDSIIISDEFIYLKDSDNQCKIISYLSDELTDIILPSTFEYKNVYEIGIRAFSNSDIRSIKIPDTITKIDEYAFENTKITEIHLSNSIKEIGEKVFDNCQCIIYCDFFENELPEKWSKTWNSYCKVIYKQIEGDNIDLQENYS